MRLRPATPADFAFIHRLTSDAANAPFMGDANAVQLAVYAQDPSCRVLIWQGDVDPAGFALFREIGNASGRVELFRLALANAGAGLGATFMAALTDFAFQDLNASRLWLDASSENPRAQKVYARAGFTLEGRLRAHWYRPALGHSVDLMMYGMMRDEWLALRV